MRFFVHRSEWRAITLTVVHLTATKYFSAVKNSYLLVKLTSGPISGRRLAPCLRHSLARNRSVFLSEIKLFFERGRPRWKFPPLQNARAASARRIHFPAITAHRPFAEISRPITRGGKPWHKK
jgi:hypothetical protein